MADENAVELYRRYRPTTLDEVVGQPEAVAVLNTLIAEDRVPQVIAFTGPSGTGKTTLARILKSILQCGDSDFMELNAADTRGIDTIREIRRYMPLAPIEGTCRMYLIDEASRLTGDSQSALLKILEDVRRNVYFFLCTTDPQRLLPTLRGRCHIIALKGHTVATLISIVQDVADREGHPIDPKAAKTIAEASDGSARAALTMLHQVMTLPAAQQLTAIAKSDDARAQGIEVARLLMNERGTWPEVAKLLKILSDDADPSHAESVRRIILGYATAILLNGKNSARAYHVLVAFEGNFYDSRMSGLVRACYEVLSSK